MLGYSYGKNVWLENSLSQQEGGRQCRGGSGCRAGSSAPGPTPTLSPSFLLAQAIFEPNIFPVWIPQHFSNLVILHLPAYEDGKECSETSAYKIQMPGNYPEESIKHVLFVCIYPLPDSDCRELFEWLLLSLYGRFYFRGTIFFFSW